MDASVKKTLDKIFPQFSSPSKSRFLEIFEKSSSTYNQINTINKNKSFDIDINNIVFGIDQRTSVIIKGFPSEMSIQAVYYVLSCFCNDIDYFYIPINIKENKKYMYSFVNVSNYLSIIQLNTCIYKLKNKKFFYHGYDFSQLEIHYSKAQGTDELSKKSCGEKEG